METIIFRLKDKKVDQNSFFLNADGTRDKDRKLDFTNTYGVLNPFFVIDANGARKYYRYIAGCSIFDPVEQEKQKIVANIQNSVIEFKAGMDIVLDKRIGALLAEFLAIHPNNSSSRYHDPKLHEAAFFTYDPYEEERKEFETVSAEDEALEILIGLRNNKERLRSVAALFNDTSGLQTDESIYIGLRAIAKSKPAVFVNSIGSRENQILADVLIASRINVIARDVKGWFFEDDQSSILLTSTTDDKEAAAELVIFLMSKKGEVFYQQLLIKKQQKEIELNAPAGEISKPEVEADARGQVTAPAAPNKRKLQTT